MLGLRGISLGAAKNDGHNGDVLKATSDYVKFLIALAVGSLVFSWPVIQSYQQYVAGAKWSLVIAWAALVLSVASGLLTQSRLMVMLSIRNYDLNDKYLKWPGRIQQVSFSAGIIAIGLSLLFIFL